MKQKKLVLFDIDGTLIYHIGKASWALRYTQAMKDIYGVRVLFDPPEKHEGSLERKIAWDELSVMGVDRQTFLKNFSRYVKRRIELFHADAARETLYQPISDAKKLVQLLLKAPHLYHVGVLTGNALSVANWKLSHAGYRDVFKFGLYGDEADDRNSLAQLVYEKAKKELGWDMAPMNLYIIGDTIHDVRCGKAIGAITIAVKTGGHTREQLEDVHPDLLVDSLMDERVLTLLGLEK